MDAQIIENKEHKGLEVYFSTKPDSKIIDALKAAFFRWHNQKKCWFAKDNEKNRELLNSLYSGTISTTPSLSPSKEQAKTNKYGVKIGDIFYISWGYEQTNVDFFQVVEIVGNVSIKIKQIAEKQTETESSMSGYVVPVKDCFIDSHFIKDKIAGDLKKVQSRNGDNSSVHIKVENYYAHLTDETTPHFTSSWG